LLAGIKAVSFGATSQTIPAGCYHNTSGLLAGASGWETDTRFAIPGARTYQVIATGTNPNGGADLVFYQPRNGGSIVNFGSITVGGSLAVDPTLSRIVENVLSRFRAQSPPPTNPYWSRQLELQRLS
jgi:hypothetical protein